MSYTIGIWERNHLIPITNAIHKYKNVQLKFKQVLNASTNYSRWMTYDLWHLRTCDFLWKCGMIWNFYDRIGLDQKSNLSSFAMHIWAHWEQNTNFPLTLHWNQKYQKVQVTISVSLHLKLLSLTFPRRQEQCLRKSIDFLDNRCPWLDWQLILKWQVHFVPKMHWKCTLTKNVVNLNLARWLLQGSHIGHVQVMWPVQSCFLLCQIENQNGGLTNRTNLINTARVYIQG